jgi:hypothetical protein
MKKFFILLAACTIGVVNNSFAMTSETSATYVADPDQSLTLDEVCDEIDDIVELVRAGEVIIGEDEAAEMANTIWEHMSSLEGLDQVNAFGYFYISFNSLEPSFGFTVERREELHELAAEWTIKIVDSDDVEAEFMAFAEVVDSLSDEEQDYIIRALPYFLEAYMAM